MIFWDEMWNKSSKDIKSEQTVKNCTGNCKTNGICNCKEQHGTKLLET